MRHYLLLVLVFSIMALSSSLFAKGVYQTNNDFLTTVFEQNIPKVKSLWLSKKIKPQIRKILGEKPSQLRVRYWGRDKQTAWILEQIGKEKLITVGLVVENNRLSQVKVLAFRESRGWEIKQAFFTEQFSQVQLQDDLQLNRHIDGISGATLSVRAMKKLAQLALFYHQQTDFSN